MKIKVVTNENLKVGDIVVGTRRLCRIAGREGDIIFVEALTTTEPTKFVPLDKFSARQNASWLVIEE